MELQGVHREDQTIILERLDLKEDPFAEDPELREVVRSRSEGSSEGGTSEVLLEQRAPSTLKGDIEEGHELIRGNS